MASHSMARDWLFVGCEKGHDWQSLGGRCASCAEWCCCSVPVYTCARCGDCDYGENDEAEQTRQVCFAKYGTPAERDYEALTQE